jgi:hypothetical protein
MIRCYQWHRMTAFCITWSDRHGADCSELWKKIVEASEAVGAYGSAWLGLFLGREPSQGCNKQSHWAGRRSRARSTLRVNSLAASASITS